MIVAMIIPYTLGIFDAQRAPASAGALARLKVRKLAQLKKSGPPWGGLLSLAAPVARRPVARHHGAQRV